jgi:hypothetical protein
MPYNPEDILQAITDLYLFLDTNFDALYSQCKAPREKADLRNVFVAARDAYWAAVAKTLADNNGTVDQITKNLVTTNAQIKGQLDGIQNMAAFINLCTGAVQLAASLATLAAIA